MFDYEKNCDISKFEYLSRPNNTDIMSFCCHYGSIKCFRQILIHNPKLSKKNYLEAIYGGNYEILQDFCNMKIPIEDLLTQASNCFNNDLFEWGIRNNCGIKKIDCGIDNIRAYLFLYQNGLLRNTSNNNQNSIFINFSVI